MNDIVKHQNLLHGNNTADELMAVLRTSVFPGAQDASIKLAIAYCNQHNLSVIQKPVHIVPMQVTEKQADGSEKKVKRDVIMPGIGLYRTQATRSKEFSGISDPVFGPDITKEFGGECKKKWEEKSKRYIDTDYFYDKEEFTFPSTCTVTVKRLMPSGYVAEFTATERWVENYATASAHTTLPNAMWKKRPYGQLGKCAEAQALRKAFPELLGSMPTAEEMEGKSLDQGLTIDNDTGTIVEKPAKYRAEEIKPVVKTSKKTDSDALASGPQVKLLKALIGKNTLGVTENALLHEFKIDCLESMLKASVNSAIAILEGKKQLSGNPGQTAGNEEWLNANE